MSHLNLIDFESSQFCCASLSSGLTFSIIITLLPTDPTNIYIFYNQEITEWVNMGCIWLYLGALIWSFVLALGNRPKGEKVSYTLLFIINAVMGFYLLAAAILLTIRALSNIKWVTDDNLWTSIKDFALGEDGILVAALSKRTQKLPRTREPDLELTQT